MALELHHRVVVIRFQCQIAALGIALEEPSLLEESRYTVTDRMHQRFEFIHTGCIDPLKAQAPIVILHIHAVEDEHVKVQRAAIGLRFKAAEMPYHPNR